MPNDDERPWYIQQSEEPSQAPQPGPIEGRGANAEIVSNYVSPQGDSSLVGSLGGGAGAPAGGMGALMLPLLMAQMQQRQQQGPLSAFANAYAQAQGRPSPIQQPQAPSQFQQFQMIHEVMKDQALEKERQARLGIAQQAQQRLADKAESDRIAKIDETERKKANFQYLESKKMLGDERPEIRRMAAANFMASAKKMGLAPGDQEDAVVNALGTGDLTHKALNENLQDLARGVPDDVILTRKGMTPEILASLKQDGGVVQALAEDTKVQRRYKAAQADKEEADAIAARNPEFAKEPKLIPAIMGRSMALYGKPYQDLTSKEKAGVMGMAQADVNDAALAQYKAEQTILQQKALQLEAVRFGHQKELVQLRQEGKFQPIYMDTKNIWVDPKGKPAQGDDVYLMPAEAAAKGLRPMSPKDVEVQNGFQRAQTMLENIKYTHEEMKKRHLYSEGNWAGGPLGAMAENLYKGTIAPKIAPTDTDRALLRNFEAQKTELISIDRALNSLGVRAFGAFAPQMSVLSPTAGAPAVELTMSQLEGALKSNMGVQRLPGVFQEKDTWKAPPLGKGQQTPQTATGTANVTLPPMSKMTFENAVARLRMQGLPPAQLEAEIANLRSKYRIIE